MAYFFQYKWGKQNEVITLMLQYVILKSKILERKTAASTKCIFNHKYHINFSVSTLKKFAEHSSSKKYGEYLFSM